MILRAVPPAEGSPMTEGWVDVRLTDSQRAWLIHCLKATWAPRANEDTAHACLVALGGQL